MAKMPAARREGSRPIKVVDVINLSTSADTLLRDRVVALRASGIDDRIVCIDGPRVEALRGLGIPVHTVHLPRNLNPVRLVLALIDLTTYLRKDQVDVVHTHCSIPGVVGRLAAWLAGVPVIVHTVHGFHFHERTSWFTRLPYLMAERLCGLVTDTLLTQNRGDLEQAERFGIGPRSRRYHIGNGVDLQRFRPEEQRESTDGRITVTCVARLEPVKNHGMLFEAVAILKRRGLSLRVRLVGDGKLRGGYQQLCRRLGIDGMVEFLGYRNDIPAILAGADIAVLTSVKEGLPRAVLEAMAAGLPVVATKVPGTREVVRHGETGLVVELGDTEGLADALDRLIGDAALRERMGQRGRKVATEEFDERPIVDRLRQLYDSRLRVLCAEADGSAGPAGEGDGLTSQSPPVGTSARGGWSMVRVGRSASFLMAAQVVYSLINVAAMVLLGNALGPAGYGAYAFYYALIPMIGSMSDAGVGIIVMRGIARDNASAPRLLGDGLLIKGAISGLILLVSVAGAWTTLDPARAMLISLVVAVSLIDPAQDPALWVFRAHGLLHLEALMLLLSQVVWLPLLMLAAGGKANLLGLLGAAGIAFVVRLTLGAVIVVRRLYRPEFRPARERLRRLVAEGVPFGAAMLGSVLYWRIGLLMLKVLATRPDMAYFNVAFLLSQSFAFIAGVLGIAIFPVVARHARHEEQALRRDLILNFKWQLLFAAPLTAGLLVLAGPIVSLLFHGRGFGPAATGLKVTSLGLALTFVNVSSRFVLAALDRQRQHFRAILAGLVAIVVLCAVLIPPLGFLGACFAYLGSEATVWVACHRALPAHVVRLRELAAQAVKPLLAAAGMGVVLLAFGGTNLFVRVAIGCVTYPALLFLLRTFTVEERRTLHRLHVTFGLPGAALLWSMEPIPQSGTRSDSKDPT
jgi:glycosyltransferase involved in cell wall biosynthesis/O-antigen/teichoic acid export membrane protein